MAFSQDQHAECVPIKWKQAETGEGAAGSGLDLREERFVNGNASRANRSRGFADHSAVIGDTPVHFSLDTICGGGVLTDRSERAEGNADLGFRGEPAGDCMQVFDEEFP